MKILTNVLLLGIGFTAGYLAKKSDLGELICKKVKRCCLRKVANNIEDAMKKDKKEKRKKEDEEYDKFIKEYKEERKKEDELYDKYIKEKEYHKIVKDNDYCADQFEDDISQEEIDDNIEYMSLEDYEDSRRNISGISTCYYQDGELHDPNITTFNYYFIRREKPGDIIIVNEIDEQILEIEIDTHIISLEEVLGSNYIKELEKDLSKQENTLVIYNNYWNITIVLRDWADFCDE